MMVLKTVIMVSKKNKPRPITREKSKKSNPDKLIKKIKIKQSAAEMICLIRYLGVIIGHKIPKNNEHWELYLILRKITAIVTSPTLTPYDITQ